MSVFGNIYQASVANAFIKDDDYLPILREEIANNNPNLLFGDQQPCIVSMQMVSGAPFSVSFMFHEDPINSEQQGETMHSLSYVGGIEFIKFVDDTTLKSLTIDWFSDSDNWKTVTFDIPENCSITVTEMNGRGYITPDVSGKYHLLQGVYIVTMTDENDSVTTHKVFVRQNGAIKIG